VIAAGSVRFAREQDGQVHQDSQWWAHRPKRRPDRLAVVSDGREVTH
jgi:hypothetical protein